MLAIIVKQLDKEVYVALCPELNHYVNKNLKPLLDKIAAEDQKIDRAEPHDIYLT